MRVLTKRFSSQFLLPLFVTTAVATAQEFDGEISGDFEDGITNWQEPVETITYTCSGGTTDGATARLTVVPDTARFGAHYFLTDRTVSFSSCTGDDNSTVTVGVRTVPEDANIRDFSIELSDSSGASVSPTAETIGIQIQPNPGGQDIDMAASIDPEEWTLPIGNEQTYVVQLTNNSSLFNISSSTLQIAIPNGLELTESVGCSGQQVLTCEIGLLQMQSNTNVSFTVRAIAQANTTQKIITNYRNNGTIHNEANPGNNTPEATISIAEADTQPPPGGGSRLLNISTNTFTDASGVQAGFVITGDIPKRIAVVAESQGLADTTLELVAFPAGNRIDFNDNWRDHPTSGAVIDGIGREPSTDLASAFTVTLPAGAYLAVMRGANGTTGRAIVAVQEIDNQDSSRLLNISTNTFTDASGVQAGFVITGDTPRRVAVVAESQSSDLTDTTLELVAFPAGNRLDFNDNWQEHPSAAAVVAGIGREPSSDLASAFTATLPQGAYLAIMRGANGTTGRAIVAVQEID